MRSSMWLGICNCKSLATVPNGAGWQAAVEAVRTFLVDVDTVDEDDGPAADS